MVLVIALSYHDYNVARLYLAGINTKCRGCHSFYLFCVVLQSFQLFRYKTVGEYAESKTIYRLVHLCMRLLVHVLFYVTYRLALEESPHTFLIGKPRFSSRYDASEGKNAEDSVEMPLLLLADMRGFSCPNLYLPQFWQRGDEHMA